MVFAEIILTGAGRGKETGDVTMTTQRHAGGARGYGPPSLTESSWPPGVGWGVPSSSRGLYSLWAAHTGLAVLS